MTFASPEVAALYTQIHRKHGKLSAVCHRAPHTPFRVPVFCDSAWKAGFGAPLQDTSLDFCIDGDA